MISVSALLLAVIFYDWLHKKITWSVVWMALARAFLVFASALCLGGELSLSLFVATIILFSYVCSLTLVARFESRWAGFQGKVPYLIAGISILDALQASVFQSNASYLLLSLGFFATLKLQKWVRGT